MKLYNLYEQLILENSSDIINQVIDGHYASNGRKYFNPVEITYRSEKSGKQKSIRQVMIYGRGFLKKKDKTTGEIISGNDAIRVFQAFGETQSKNSEWKTLLVNNITNIEVKDFKFYMQPSDVSGGGDIPNYVGPQDKSFYGNKLKRWVTFD